MLGLRCSLAERTRLPGTLARHEPMTSKPQAETTSKHLPLCQALHQRADAERPGLALIAVAHAVDELAELRRRDRDDVVALVGKTLARRVAVLDRGEHRAQEQRKSVRILMLRPDGLGDEIGRIAADLADR